MTDDHRKPVERRSTDESLRVERHKTDAQLEGTFGAITNADDDLVADARHKADSVLSDAREREDRKLAADGELDDAAGGLERERAHEDAVLAAERGGADHDVMAARARRQLAMVSLLAHERRDTDLRLELERTRADQALTSREDFMAMVSHDLRTLLGSIALSADLVNQLAAARAPIEKVVRYAESIQRFCGQMNRIVGDLMDVASIEADKLSIVRELSDPAQLVRDSIAAFQPAALIHQIELSCVIADRIDSVRFDPARVLQVLTNLVGNALKFTPKGGQISIRTESLGDGVCFAVSDTGEGIPAERLTQIFDRYFQTRENDRRGLGLGLFIVKSIVEAHGGRVWAESTPGKGSTFIFTIPGALTSATPGTGSAPPRPSQPPPPSTPDRSSLPAAADSRLG
jgi:signal transduction histidine kinase